nr:hypothetical protein CFP56_31794 [Quercus suber]
MPGDDDVDTDSPTCTSSKSCPPDAPGPITSSSTPPDPDMIDNTPAAYVFIRFTIFILHFLAPACSLYTIVYLRKAFLRYQWQREIPQFTIFQYYCLAETLFYAFFLWYRTHLQREATHPELRSKEQRRELFDNVKRETHDPKLFLQGWFRGANVGDIGRQQMEEFVDWGFFEGRAKSAGCEEEVEKYVSEIEEWVGNRFKEGKGTARPLRLTLDPIEMECRSLFWYSLMMIVDSSTHIKMLWWNFEYYYTPATSLHIFPPRPVELVTFSRRSPAKRLSYWLRPHTSKTRLPVLFLHGLGIGLYPNAGFIHELDLALNSTSAKDDGQVGIMVVEILPISSRLTHAIHTRQEFLEQLTQVLDAHDYRRFVLACHSYGSVLTSNILTNPKLVRRVAATLFIDPVTILLHMPDVAYNFTVRQPKKANEWQLWFFAAKDPGVAYTLGRHFFWSENLLWREQIVEMIDNGMRVTVSLGSRDLIVDTPAVGRYLMKHTIPDPVMKQDGRGATHMALDSKGGEKGEEWKNKAWQGRGLEVLWFEGLDHAQVFDTESTRRKLVDVLVEYSKDGKRKDGVDKA